MSRLIFFQDGPIFPRVDLDLRHAYLVCPLHPHARPPTRFRAQGAWRLAVPHRFLRVVTRRAKPQSNVSDYHVQIIAKLCQQGLSKAAAEELLSMLPYLVRRQEEVVGFAVVPRVASETETVLIRAR